MILETLGLIALCLFLPALWGWLAYLIFTRLRLYRLLPGPRDVPVPPEVAASVWDYQI